MYLFFSGEAFLRIMETFGKQGTAFLQTEKRRVQNLLKGQVNKKYKRLSLQTQ
jgi:hypothetical protein